MSHGSPIDSRFEEKEREGQEAAEDTYVFHHMTHPYYKTVSKKFNSTTQFLWNYKFGVRMSLTTLRPSDCHHYKHGNYHHWMRIKYSQPERK